MTTTVITGASSGLGAELARQLVARGEDVALCARRRDRLEELAADLRAAHPGPRVLVQPMDVTDDDAVAAAFAALHDQLGEIDRVIVNAGVADGAPLGTGGHARNRRTTATNVLGTLAQADAALERFRAQGHGHLVLVASMAALRGLPGSLAAYSASKAAVAQLGAGLQVELAGTPLRVTVLHPGYVATEMNAGARPGPLMSSAPAAVRAMIAAIDRGRRTAVVPPWPYAPLAVVLRLLPGRWLRRATPTSE